MTFDVLKEPWIPVARLDGTMTDMGLREVLLQAPRLREIRDPLPIVEFGLYRLLVALVMDMFELTDTDRLEDLLESGEFDPAKVDQYFEKWRNRFDLFHPEYPFLQSAGMDNESDKPLAGLIPAVPSGTNASHFHHRGEKEFEVSPASGARLLTTIAPFMTAGGAGLAPSVNGAPPWYVLIKGDSLFETICLNCCTMPLLKAVSGKSPPAWRNPAPIESCRCTQTSLLEALTWRPRKVQLVPGSAGKCSLSGRESPVLIRSVKFVAGASCDFSWCDPSVPYKISDKGALVMRPQAGREVWRDIGPIALLQEDEYTSDKGKIRFSRPRIIDQFATLVNTGVLDSSKPLCLQIYGMRTDLKMKVFEWHREELGLPAPLVVNSAYHRDLQEAMDVASSVEYQLKRALKHAYPRGGAGNKAAFDAIITHAQRHFWSTLWTSYDSLLHKLSNLPREGNETLVAEHIATWEQELRHIAMRALDEAIDGLDTDGDALKRQVESRRMFRTSLNTLLQNSLMPASSNSTLIESRTTESKGGKSGD